MALTKKEKKEARRARYGMKKVGKGNKVAWLSQQNKNGFSLGLAIGNKKTIWLTNTRFSTQEEVIRALESAVHFITLKDLG